VNVRPADECRWDLVALGEVMLRFDPGDGRIATTRAFTVSEGGGEYNVARGLRRCFGLRTALVSAFADNAVGRLLEDLVLQGGVDQAHVTWTQSSRVGLNFVERGYGVRAALGVSDRADSAAAAMRPGDVDWAAVFGSDGVRWFHTGGIFAAVGAGTAPLALEGMRAAHAHGTVVSFDLNFRPSLWKSGDAASVNRELVSHVDVLFGNEEDLSAALGYGTFDEDADAHSYAELHRRVLDDFPQLQLIATSLRAASTATVNDWGGVCSTRDEFFVGPELDGLEIFDRVGGGDSFASGLIYGLLSGFDVATSLAYAVAHGALAMTTPGDTSMATLAEVARVVAGESARVLR
jgi:2-dehydro-3-deoxygluconokinase